eukprot:9488140-Pyramimonas_sp.AAC.1
MSRRRYGVRTVSRCDQLLPADSEERAADAELRGQLLPADSEERADAGVTKMSRRCYDSVTYGQLRES